MLTQIHEALTRLLYRDAKLPEEQLDIRFGTPTGEWVSGLTRPTVNFFLHDISENLELRRMDQLTQLDNGRLIQHLAARRINLKYLITVFFKAQLDEYGRDEWEVLWRVLATLMRHNEWPEDLLPRPVRALGLNLHGQVAQPDGPRTGEIFTSLGLSPRPHLTYTLTVPLDLNLEQISRLVLERDTALKDTANPDQRDREPALHTTRSTWQARSATGAPLAGLLVTAEDGTQGYTDRAGHVTLDLALGLSSTFTLQHPDGKTEKVVADPTLNILQSQRG